MLCNTGIGTKETSLRNYTFGRGIPAGNPIANIFVIIVGALAITASLVLGFFAFVIVGSIVLILAAIVGLRVWWFKRTLERRSRSGKGGDGGSGSGVIEGEYRVVAEDGDGE